MIFSQARLKLLELSHHHHQKVASITFWPLNFLHHTRILFDQQRKPNLDQIKTFNSMKVISDKHFFQSLMDFHFCQAIERISRYI